MLSRLFGTKLPKPTDEQESSKLMLFPLSIETEITAIAFEPRFQLIAMGTANGKLYIFNNEKHYYASESTTYFPVCKILALPNTSSFFSACSPYMLKNHPYSATNRKASKFKEIDPSKSLSIVVHWIIRTDEIEPRVNKIQFNIIDFAISPTHPNFAMILTDNGSLYGYSIEELKFTNLYINIFEGKPATSVFSESNMVFYVTHEKINSIDIQTMYMNDYCNEKAKTFDLLDGFAAIIDKDNTPRLIKGNKKVQKVTPIEGSSAVFSGIITKKDWVTIFHSDNGDKIFFKGEEKISLDNENLLVPGCIIQYEDFYHRANPEFVAFVTENGKLIFLDGRQENYFFTEEINPLKIFEDNEHFYIFSEEKILDFDQIYFNGIIENKFGIPLAMKNNKVLVQDSETKSILIKDIKTLESQQILSEEYSLINISESIISFRCKDNVIMKIDITKDEFVCEKVEDDNFYPSEDIIMWRDYKDTKILITNKNELILKKSKIEIYEKEEKIILFEPICENGKTNKEGPFILIVTEMNVYLFVIENEKLKRARKESPGHILDATITEWGSLLLKLDKSIQIIALPDISYSPLFNMSYSPDAKICLIPHKGLFLFEKGKVFVFLKNYTSKPIYDPNVPQLKLPKVGAFKKLLGAKEANLKDTDEAFQHKRSQFEASKLSETKELMQQILVTAQKRGETLNEMEIKANRISNAAQRYHEICKELAKK